MPTPHKCGWCNAENRQHTPSCPVGREKARLEELNQSMQRHPSVTKRSLLTLVEAERHAPDCDCSWSCRYFAAHADDVSGVF
jgi:hypothetical protein